MKKTKVLLVVMLLISYAGSSYTLLKKRTPKYTTSISLAEQVYNRLVVKTRVVEFTNKYIDSKKQENPQVPDIVWLELRNIMPYSGFKLEAINILNTNLSNLQLQQLINDFADKPFIPIPSLKIKMELYDATKSFQSLVDQIINETLDANGF